MTVPPTAADWSAPLPGIASSDLPPLKFIAGNKPAAHEIPMSWNGYDRPRLEFSVPLASSDETHFRHSGWHVRRQKVWDAMAATHVGSSRRDSFFNCGAALWVQVNAQGDEYRTVCNTCHDRFCDPCGRTRARRINFNLKTILKNKRPLFLTLTLRHSTTPLADQIDRLLRSFTRLRHRAWWKANVYGGAAFMELKVSAFDDLWHVHLHLLVDSEYLPQRKLSDEWHAVTGDSSIVDVREPKSLAVVANYVVKYVTKPADSSVFAAPDRLQEMMTALRGRRLCLTFGTWRKLPLEDLPDDGQEWTAVASVAALVARFDEGDPEAIRIIEALDRKYPTFIAHYVRPPPPS